MTVEGLADLERAFARLSPSQRDVQRVLDAAGFTLEGHAKAQIVATRYVDTGLTLNSTQNRRVMSGTDSAENTVGPTTEYSVYGEFGTATQPARGFMRRAFDEGRQPALNAAAAEMRSQVEGAI